ncbi:response regulator [Robertmurraya kyonggiensis]|uniref:Response regulator n=1 Tax=Robertmurraya kyonggiensis TaxID=1037680 RepID=A0A4U1CY32_9BACI|nr:response regulator [Robertmurraya kyonggiensis]TKC14420.1 response regulator [Robertmurraya kyonggiensis]
MRVLIAEDEFLERKAMKKFIEENFEDTSVIGEAVNGREAIELTAKIEPDIILMDIKMPGINGLEAIEIIKKNHPDSKFIIISAYDSFHYAKQAIGLGVKDYILKPSKKAEMLEVFTRIMSEIRTEQENKRSSHSIASELWMTKLMKHESSESLAALQRTLYPEMQSGYFFILSEKVEDVEFLVEKASHFSGDTVITKEDDHHLVLLFIAKVKRRKTELLKVARNIHNLLDSRTLIGIGQPYLKITDLPRSFHEALTAIQDLKHVVHRQYGFEGEVDREWERSMEQIFQGVAEGNEEKAIHALSELFKTEPQEHFLHELFYRVKHLMDDKQVNMPSRSFVHMHSEQEWTDFIKLCCFNIQLYYKSKDKIERAKRYIHVHYQEPIALEEVAQMVQLSPNYFSALFKESCGETFIDYLTTIRMNKAKELLVDQNISLKEICFLVGYKDPNYFSRVFKKQFQVSPKQYKQSIVK